MGPPAVRSRGVPSWWSAPPSTRWQRTLLPLCWSIPALTDVPLPLLGVMPPRRRAHLPAAMGGALARPGGGAPGSSIPAAPAAAIWRSLGVGPVGIFMAAALARRARFFWATVSPRSTRRRQPGRLDRAHVTRSATGRTAGLAGVADPGCGGRRTAATYRAVPTRRRPLALARCSSRIRADPAPAVRPQKTGRAGKTALVRESRSRPHRADTSSRWHHDARGCPR